LQDDFQRNRSGSDRAFEPLQLLGYDAGALSRALCEYFKWYGFQCEPVQEDCWALTYPGGGERLVLLRRESAWHAEVYGFGPKVADGRTFKVDVPDSAEFEASLTRAQRAQALADLVVRRFAERVWPNLLSRRERPRRRPRRRR
jgi:hypothetical protein